MVYLGLNNGAGFGAICNNYKMCFGFEPDPELFSVLKETFSHYRHVHLFNAAVATHDGMVTFNIASNGGMSSSLGTFRMDWGPCESGSIKVARQVTVSCINLMTFLTERRIDFIDDYISDIKGMDLAVFTTLKPMIDQGRIRTIQCEVAKDERGNIYDNLPDNSALGFQHLLSSKCKLFAAGWSTLTDNNFEGVPEDWWEMDCRWRLRQSAA